MTAADITDYYLEHSRTAQTTSNAVPLNLPIIESWMCVDMGEKVVIRGMVHNHPKHSSGKRIKTSPIQGCLCKASHVYVTTKNSMYQLGTPRSNSIDTPKPLNGYTETIECEKLTYWK